MRLALVSDIHANLEALRATLDDIAAQGGVDRILCLGDIVGYNADPGACIALLREVGALCVAGNHDRAAAGLISTEVGFSETAARAMDWTRRRLGEEGKAFLAGLPLQACVEDRLVAVHGALLPDGRGCDTTRLQDETGWRMSLEALAAHPSGARVCAFGHTHRLGAYELREGVLRTIMAEEIELREGAQYLLNPGTVGQPYTPDRRATYLLLDTARMTATVRRVGYDISVPLAKSRRAGLVPLSTGLPAPVRTIVKWGTRRLGLYDAVKRMADLHQRRRAAADAARRGPSS